MKKRKAKYIIFDFDGVLCDIDFKKIGKMIAIRLKIPLKYHLSISEDVYNAIMKLFSLTDIKMTKKVVVSVLEKEIPKLAMYGLTADQLYEELSSTKYNYCYNNPFAANVLAYLRSEGYRLFTKSNWFSSVQIHHFERFGYLKYFSLVYGLEDEYLKPNPKSIKGIIGNRNPKDFVIIGDTLQKEIFLANYFGMKSIWLNERGEPRKEGRMLIPTYEIQSIMDIKDIL